MKQEIVEHAKKLTEVIEQMSEAAQGSALHMAGSLVTIKKWVRAMLNADEAEMHAFVYEFNNAAEKLEDLIADQIQHSSTARNVADSRLNTVVEKVCDVLSQYSEKDVHPINDQTVRAQVWGLTGGKCAYCQIDLAPDGQGNGESHTYCVEHVVPVSYGGPNNIRNYVPSCRSCNNSKGDKHVLTFIRNNLPARLEKAELRLVANSKEPWIMGERE